MVDLLINLFIVVIVIGVLFWLIDYVPLKDPFPKILRVVLVLIAVIVVIDLLLSLRGGGFGLYPLRR